MRAEALRRALASVGSGEEEPELRCELEAERARDLMWDERTRVEARELASAVLARASPAEVVARARALDVLGRLASWFSATGPQPEAEGLLRESARLARQIGQPTWTAQTLVALGPATCSRSVATRPLSTSSARHSRSCPLATRATVQTFRVDSLIELARWDEAEAAIADMREIGEAVREAWILAFAAWVEAAMASYMGDGDRCVRAYHEIDRHPGDWREQPSGGECFAQVADHLSRVGQTELAVRCLRRAEAKMEGNERIVRVHGAAVLARVGGPWQAQTALADVLEGPAAEPHELWPIRLQQAHRRPASGRLGSGGGAGSGGVRVLRRDRPSAGPARAGAAARRGAARARRRSRIGHGSGADRAT